MSVIPRRPAWIAALVLILPLLATVAPLATPAAAATTFVVDTAQDLSSLDDCTPASGDCSLRGAIKAANASPGKDTILFGIPSGECPGGVCRIYIATGGFTISEAVDIDATTQPRNGAPQANICAIDTEPSYMRVEVLFDAGVDRFIFYINHATGSTSISGLALGTNAPSDVFGIMSPSGNGHHFACNHIGMNASGTGGLGSAMLIAGVFLSYDSNGVTVGTDGDGVGDVGERNLFGIGTVDGVFVESTVNHLIAGNYFGLNAAGTMKLGGGGLYLSRNTDGVRVGTDSDGVSDEAERNYFSGAINITVASAGFDPSGLVIAGNTFGLSPTGALTSSGIGIDVSGIPLSTIGFEIRGNTFGRVESAIDSTADGGDVVITGNTFGGSSNGKVLSSIVPIRVGGSSSYEISNNLISNAELAGVVVEDTATLDPASRRNCLVGNFFGLTHTGVVDELVFEGNWWGDTSGPSGAGTGSGNGVSTRVDFDPWLTTPAPPCNAAPVAADANFTIAEDAAPGTVLGTISVTDDGDDLNYAITAGNPGGVFAVDAAGQLSVAKALDYETTPAYLLTVTVSDPYLSDTASVAAVVSDVDEPEPEPTFRDVPATHTFYADIEWLAAQGITRGCNPPTNDMFCPGSPVTRGQMAAFLHRALGDVLTVGAPVDFVDDDGSVFEADIEWLGSVGVTRGCNPPTNDRFCPGDAVTRAQMAAFLSRALELPAAGDDIEFVDDDGSIFEDDIERLAAAGITRGCNPPTNDMFCPNDPVTRGQMAAFLHRALG